MAELIVDLRDGSTLNFASGISVLPHPRAVRDCNLRGLTIHDADWCTFVIQHDRALHVVDFFS